MNRIIVVSIPTHFLSTSTNNENKALDTHFKKKQFPCLLVLPVIFKLGRHDPRSFHANVDFLQAEGERVCELHRHHHLFINLTPT